MSKEARENLHYKREDAKELERRARQYFPRTEYRGKHYFLAAKKRLEVGDIGKAIKDYEKASQSYKEYAQDNHRFMSRGNEERLYDLAKKSTINANRLRKVRGGKWHGLEGIAAVIATIGFLSSIFFLFPSFTGNTIGNLSSKSTGVFGWVLLLIGSISALIYFKK